METNETNETKSAPNETKSATVDKKTFLEIVDNDRIDLPYSEMASILPHQNEDEMSLLCPRSLTEPMLKPFPVAFVGAEKLSKILVDMAIENVARGKTAWHALAAMLTDEEWDAAWRVNYSFKGVAAACAQWRAERALV
jgi:hypothetical protein